MKKHLFLTGAERTKLSALLRETLWERLAEAGGLAFVPDGAGGLKLLPAAALGGVEGFEAETCLLRTPEGARSDNELIRGTGTRLLREAVCYPFAVLDGIGGFELLIPQFREALTELLNAPIPLVGLIIRPEEAERQRLALGLGEKMSLYPEQLRRALQNDRGSDWIDASGLGALRAGRALENWAKSCLNNL